MKYYFILTDGRDAWVQFVYLPTGDDGKYSANYRY